MGSLCMYASSFCLLVWCTRAVLWGQNAMLVTHAHTLKLERALTTLEHYGSESVLKCNTRVWGQVVVVQMKQHLVR